MTMDGRVSRPVTYDINIEFLMSEETLARVVETAQADDSGGPLVCVTISADGLRNQPRAVWRGES